MTKILAAIAALTLMGAAALPVRAGAAELKPGVSNEQATDVSSRHRGWRHGRYYGHRYGGPRRYYAHRYWGPRRYYGPRYGYYGYPYPYRASPYGYYRPGLAFGFGPFGLRVF